MLHAIFRGKAGRLEGGTGEGVSWRSVYKDREDLLTAAVISRLAYLPGEMAWQILSRNAVKIDGTPLERVGALERSPEFWPRYRLDQDGEIEVEPDAILRFEHAFVILEAKRSDEEAHFAQQWAREWAAYQRSETPSRPCLLFALGGFERLTNQRLRAVANATRRQLSDYGDLRAPFRVAACSWYELVRSIVEERRAQLHIADRGTVRVLDDLLLALDLHGVRAESWLDDLGPASINFEPSRESVLLGLGVYRRRHQYWLADLAGDVKDLLPIDTGAAHVLG
jgi:hypothetical protein